MGWQECRLAGNSSLRNGKHSDAVRHYTEALSLLQGSKADASACSEAHVHASYANHASRYEQAKLLCLRSVANNLCGASISALNDAQAAMELTEDEWHEPVCRAVEALATQACQARVPGTEGCRMSVADPPEKGSAALQSGLECGGDAWRQHALELLGQLVMFAIAHEWDTAVAYHVEDDRQQGEKEKGEKQRQAKGQQQDTQPESGTSAHQPSVSSPTQEQSPTEQSGTSTSHEHCTQRSEVPVPPPWMSEKPLNISSVFSHPAVVTLMRVTKWHDTEEGINLLGLAMAFTHPAFDRLVIHAASQKMYKKDDPADPSTSASTSGSTNGDICGDTAGQLPEVGSCRHSTMTQKIRKDMMRTQLLCHLPSSHVVVS